MSRSALRNIAGFLFGAGVLIGPALAFLPQSSSGRLPPAVRHDYFPPPHLAQDPTFRIVAFGSSSTRGFGASRDAATYPAQLQAMLDAAAPPGQRFAVINRGVNGDDIDSMMARLDDDILPRQAPLVLWQLGSNDALRDVTPEHFALRLRDGVARLRAHGSAVVLIGPQWNADPARSALFEAMTETALAVGRETGIPVVDRAALMGRWIAKNALTPGDLIGPDALHLTDRGYALMARAVFEVLATEVPAVKVRLGGGAAGG